MLPCFATLLRRIAFDVDAGDEMWLRSLSAAGFSEEDIDHIYNHVCDHDWIHNKISELIDNDPSDPCAMDYNIIQQFYENAWVSQEFIPNVLQIDNGSAAGYSLCMSRPHLC